MSNLRLFEFEDLSWFPNTIRESMTDYLRYFLKITDFYAPVAPLLQQAIQNTQSQRIIDLCSGSGGPVEQIQQQLRHLGCDVPMVLTDKFPNFSSYRLLNEKDSQILFADHEVDATDVPQTLTGFRTLFSGFHHFDQATARQVLQNAVDANAGIAIFDGGDKNILTIFGILFLQPIGFVFWTPFFRPFRFSRIVFTYLIPIIPICTVWDGAVSILRLYTPKDLQQMASETGGNYHWQSGKVKNKWGMHIAYLIGYPAKN
jgi:hypothetical protein